MANQAKKDQQELKYFIKKIVQLDDRVPQGDKQLEKWFTQGYKGGAYRNLEKKFDKAYDGLDPAGIVDNGDTDTSEGFQFANLLGVDHDHHMDNLLQHLLDSN